MKEATKLAAFLGLINHIDSMLLHSTQASAEFLPDVSNEALDNTLSRAFSFIRQNTSAFSRFFKEENLAEFDHETLLRVSIADQLILNKLPLNMNSALTDHKQYLVSIFDRIHQKSRMDVKSNPHFLPLKTLQLDEEHIFPQIPQGDYQERYADLLAGLKNSLKINVDDSSSFIENLMTALHNYAWCVPSAVEKGYSDVSLYDHARMTSALAVCLTDFDNEQLKEINALIMDQPQQYESKDDKLNKPIALFVGGDISGIQDFIYTLTAKHAAKTLRGRSFYLQLLTEAILRFVLRSLDIPYTNVIYTGGGHFFLLTPVSAIERLPIIQKEISQKLLKFHGTQLYLAMGWSSIPLKAFTQNSLSSSWKQMHANLHIKKLQRYTELDPDQLNDLFSPAIEGGNADKLCAVCGREHTSVASLGDVEEDTKKIRICSLCNSFAEEIGKELPRTEYVRFGLSTPVQSQEYTALAGLAEFGMHVSFDDSPFTTAMDQSVVWKMSDTKIPERLLQGSVIWQHYVVNKLPLDKSSQVLSFDALQEEGKGIHRLGVLRMDVDNLGEIFKSILSDDQGNTQGSLVHLSTLSSRISLFFEGYIRKVLDKTQYKGQIYSVYSGGDDLFLIGPWHLMPEVALDIVKALETYTGNSPDVHLSGGLSFIHGKYPIHAAAEDAGDLEKSAKTTFGAEKNAFAFLGEVFHWTAFEKVKAHKDSYIHIISDLKGPKSLLHQIQALDEMQKEAKKKSKHSKPVWGPWMWMGDYQIFRLQERYKGELRNKLHTLHDEIKSGAYPYAELHDWAVAARWAELELR